MLKQIMRSSLQVIWYPSQNYFMATSVAKKVGCPSVGPLRLDDGSLSDDPFVMAEKFALAFASVYDGSIPNHDPADHQTSSCHMQQKYTWPWEVVDEARYEARNPEVLVILRWYGGWA